MCIRDSSLGNPSIPAPKKVNESIHKIVDETDSIKLPGYSMAPGFAEARAAVAKDRSARFGLDVKASELFFTCGAAPALISIIKALTVDHPGSYTHLDVYKRQAPVLPSCRACKPLSPFFRGCAAYFRIERNDPA